VAEAVAVAGGFRDTAKHSQVLLFRRISDQWMEAKKLDLKKMLKAGDLSEDLHLRTGKHDLRPEEHDLENQDIHANPVSGRYHHTAHQVNGIGEIWGARNERRREKPGIGKPKRSCRHVATGFGCASVSPPASGWNVLCWDFSRRSSGNDIFAEAVRSRNEAARSAGTR
jgi:hypothetical protein